MPRIENAAIEAEVASSLLNPAEQAEEQAGPEPQESEYSAHGDDLLSEAIEESRDNVLRDGDERTETMRSERPEVEQPQQAREQRQAPPEAQEQQAPEPSLQDVQSLVEGYDGRLKECGYSEPEETLRFEMGLADMFGTNLTAENLGLMDKTIGRAALSAGELVASGRFPEDGDIAKIPPVSLAVADQVSREVGAWFGRDPQTSPVYDKQFLGNAIYRGMANLVNTVAQTGKADPREVNDPAMCISWCEAIHFGVTGKQRQFSAEEACPLVNFITTRVLGLDGKLQQVQARQGQGGRSNTGRGRGQRGQRIPAQFREALKGSKAPRFKTNSGPNDPFNNQAMDEYAQRNARL